MNAVGGKIAKMKDEADQIRRAWSQLLTAVPDSVNIVNAIESGLKQLSATNLAYVYNSFAPIVAAADKLGLADEAKTARDKLASSETSLDEGSLSALLPSEFGSYIQEAINIRARSN